MGNGALPNGLSYRAHPRLYQLRHRPDQFLRKLCGISHSRLGCIARLAPRRKPQSVTIPARRAAEAACVRLTTPSALKIAVMCDLVVFSETSSARLISLLDSPRHNWRNTSVC